MSLILGVNLCDRIYICADSRLTNKKGEVILDIKDKLVKVERISDDINVAVAGDANMASFIVKKLIKNKIENNIRVFRDKIEDILFPIVDDYWRDKNSKASACFIFGGLNREDRKVLHGKDIYSKVLHFSKVDKDGVNMNMKPALFNAVMKNSGKPIPHPGPPDSHLFSVRVSPDIDPIIEDAEWGEYLAYGPNGITKNELSDIILGRLEFASRENDFSHDNMVITALMKEVAEKYQEETIGGSIFISMTNEHTSGILTGRIGRIDPKTGIEEHVSEIIVDGRGVVYSKDVNGSLLKLISIKDYKDFGSLYL